MRLSPGHCASIADYTAITSGGPMPEVAETDEGNPLVMHTHVPPATGGPLAPLSTAGTQAQSRELALIEQMPPDVAIVIAGLLCARDVLATTWTSRTNNVTYVAEVFRRAREDAVHAWEAQCDREIAAVMPIPTTAWTESRLTRTPQQLLSLGLHKASESLFGATILHPSGRWRSRMTFITSLLHARQPSQALRAIAASERDDGLFATYGGSGVAFVQAQLQLGNLILASERLASDRHIRPVARLYLEAMIWYAQGDTHAACETIVRADAAAAADRVDPNRRYGDDTSELPILAHAFLDDPRGMLIALAKTPPRYGAFAVAHSPLATAIQHDDVWLTAIRRVAERAAPVDASFVAPTDDEITAIALQLDEHISAHMALLTRPH